MRILGLVNYFSDFVDHFSDTARPLYKVLKGTVFSKKRRHGRKLIIPDWDPRRSPVLVLRWRISWPLKRMSLDRVFPDNLRTLGKINGTKMGPRPETGELVRWFKVQIGGRRSRRLMKEADLTDVVVKLYDKRAESAAATATGSAGAEEGK